MGSAFKVCHLCPLLHNSICMAYDIICGNSHSRKSEKERDGDDNTSWDPPVGTGGYATAIRYSECDGWDGAFVGNVVLPRSERSAALALHYASRRQYTGRHEESWPAQPGRTPVCRCALPGLANGAKPAGDWPGRFQ